MTAIPFGLFRVSSLLRCSITGCALLAAVGISASAEAQAGPGETAIITAYVADTAGRPITGAEISVAGTEVRGVTDNAGQLYLSGVPARKVTLRVRRIGYRETSLDLTLTAGVRSEARAVMTPSPPQLAKVVVRSPSFKPERYAKTGRFDNFFRRKESGNGTFLTKEYIDARDAQRPEDLLRSVPGIRIRYRGNVPFLEFVRCRQVNVYIDGLRAHGGFRDFLNLSPRDIEAIEIYQGLAEVPAEFSPRPNDCAAIAVWTRWIGG
jgi:hypothetical protein